MSNVFPLMSPTVHKRQNSVATETGSGNDFCSCGGSAKKIACHISIAAMIEIISSVGSFLTA